MKPLPAIYGTVSPDFEAVESLYRHMMQTLAEEHTQLCVYHQGRKVVDLWGTTSQNPGFTANSLFNVFSSSKNFESLAIASLFGKGLLSYHARITDYWPEFGANGKGDLTIAELMRHEAGLATFNRTLSREDMLRENIKQNSIGRIIEALPQTYRKSGLSRREYHVTTRGWIVNEVFRRVDPEGRTIGEYLREEIQTPLDADVYIGVSDRELARILRVAPHRAGFQMVQGLIPRRLGRRMEFNLIEMIVLIAQLVPVARTGTTMKAPRSFEGLRSVSVFSDPEIARAEIPSGNANCSARGLARVASMLSTGGQWNGTEILSESAWQSMHAEPVRAHMGYTTTAFTQGGVALFNQTTEESTDVERLMNNGREGFYGWMGVGGSVFQWHPEYQIGFGYVPSALHVLDLVNRRGKAYQAEVLRCVENLPQSN